MSSDYRAIGDEILEKIEIDPTRLDGALQELNAMVRGYLERGAWKEVPTHCESAYKFCDEMWNNLIDTAYAEGIFHAYEGVSHLYRAEEAKEKRGLSDESAELAKAVDCLEKSRQSFHFGYRDQWNEHIICLSLERLYRSQNRLKEALLASQRILSIGKTCILFGVLPVMYEIAAGKEKPASDDIIGYMRQTGEFGFEFEGQKLKAELLRGSRLFLPECDYVAMLVLGDSMDKAGISPNDYVILKKSKPDSSGDIVAVVFRDEADNRATLKRFEFDKSSGNVTLKPESSNPEHKTRVLRPEAFAGDSPSVEVVGIAIAVLKLQR